MSLPLFEPLDGPIYRSQGDVPFEVGRDTSEAAARSITGGQLNRLEAVVYRLIEESPRTCDAIEAASGLSHQTVSARVRGLVLRDRIVDSGLRATTRSGRSAVIWQTRRAAGGAQIVEPRRRRA